MNTTKVTIDGVPAPQVKYEVRPSRQPGFIGRHAHFLVAVLLIAICGFVSQDVGLMLAAVALEFVLQVRHNDQNHPESWLVGDGMLVFSFLLFVATLVVDSFKVFAHSSRHGWTMPIYLFGLAVASCTVHRIVHKWNRPRISAFKKEEYVVKVLIGVGLMVYATLLARP